MTADERRPIDLMAGDLLSAPEAAKLLNVRESTLRAWTRQGHVPCFRLGPRAIRYSRPLLEEWIASRLDPGR